MKLQTLFAFAAVLAGLPRFANAQYTATEEVRLIGAGIGTNQGYGSCVDIDGPTVVVGVPRYSTGLGGRVFVYTRSGGLWSQQAELIASDDAQNGFGSSVALEGDTLVIGARSATTSGFIAAGAAYVFVRSGTTWTEQQKVVASDPEQSAEFGYAVALSGNTFAVGAPQSTSSGSLYAGATYVFVRSGSTWSLQQRIVPADTFVSVYGSRSGRALALSGDSLLIGAPLSFDQPSGTSEGVVYEWTRAGSVWSQAAEIHATDVADNRQFGCSIGYDGTRAVVGAWAESQLPAGLNVGTAYVFRRANWLQEGELIGTALDNSDSFGWSVDLDGLTVVVGAPNGASTAGAGSGTVRLFDFDGTSWTQRLALVGSATSNNDRLGIAVALDGGLVVAGANIADTPTNGFSGEAYVWSFDPPATSTYCTAKTNSLGCMPAIGSTGTPSASSPAPFFVTASQILNQKQGLLFYGYAPAATPFRGGYLCVQPPTRRMPVTNSLGSPSGSDCTGAYSYDFNAQIQGGLDPALVAGEDAYGQFWYRDPQSPSTTGLSDGLRMHIQP